MKFFELSSDAKLALAMLEQEAFYGDNQTAEDMRKAYATLQSCSNWWNRRVLAEQLDQAEKNRAKRAEQAKQDAKLEAARTLAAQVMMGAIDDKGRIVTREIIVSGGETYILPSGFSTKNHYGRPRQLRVYNTGEYDWLEVPK